MIFRAYKVGHIITFYAECIAATDLIENNSTHLLCTFKPPYIPAINYIVVPLRGKDVPFPEIATLWIRNNGNGILYGTIASGTRFYIQGSFTY